MPSPTSTYGHSFAMTEPARIAAALSDHTDLAAAALLVAICFSDVAPLVPAEDMHLIRQLERLGCVHEGKRTPLGAKVALRLEALGVVEHVREMR